MIMLNIAGLMILLSICLIMGLVKILIGKVDINICLCKENPQECIVSRINHPPLLLIFCYYHYHYHYYYY